MADPAKIDTVRGRQVLCPKCGSGNIRDYNPIMIRVDLFTCYNCGTTFNAYNGSTGPFVVFCSKGHDMPCDELSTKCVICHEDLEGCKERAILDWNEPACSNCYQRNPRGSNRCIRCGMHISSSGQVIQIR